MPFTFEKYQNAIYQLTIKFSDRNGLKLAATVISIIISYYVAIILHEWGHGTVAWLFGYKKMFFDVDYGGWFLLSVNEDVPYDQIVADNRGDISAFIGIAGVTVSIILFLVSIAVLKKIKRSVWIYSFFYWFAVINMIPIIQYLFFQTFSSQGDVGQFTHGLKISPWWVFVPGFTFVCFSLFSILEFALPKAYVLIDIKTQWARRAFLLVSLGIMFLLIYINAYNPLSDKGMLMIGKILAFLSMLIVPILFFLCDPSRRWVKMKIQKHRLLNTRKSTKP